MDIAIVSGGFPARFRSHENHAVYAKRWRMVYYRDNEPREGLQTPHFRKLAAVLDVLKSHDWVLWVDDDAFFTDLKHDMRRFVRHIDTSKFFVACKSPVNPKGGWTYLNSGVFFLRNCQEGRRFIESAITVPKPEVENAWNESVYGIRTPGEQSHLIHVIHRDSLQNNIVLHPWQSFNARPYHWNEGAKFNQFPVVHFPLQDKHNHILAFAKRFGLDENLIPKTIWQRTASRILSIAAV